MKTEHAIDWRKSAAEIQDDVESVCKQRDELVDQVAELTKHNGILGREVQDLIRQRDEAMKDSLKFKYVFGCMRDRRVDSITLAEIDRGLIELAKDVAVMKGETE